MHSFWKVRIWVWIIILVVIWTAFQGPQNFPTDKELIRQVGYSIGILISLAFWIILIEIPYRLIAWILRKAKPKP